VAGGDERFGASGASGFQRLEREVVGLVDVQRWVVPRRLNPEVDASVVRRLFVAAWRADTPGRRVLAGPRLSPYAS
jgi:hypothetical protein